MLLFAIAVMSDQVLFAKIPIPVMVSVLPQVEWVKQIGGPFVSVEALLPPGANPHMFELSPSQLKKLCHAQIYIQVGYIAFETANANRLKKLNPRLNLFNSSHNTHTIRETSSGHGHFESVDPHTWESPLEAIQHVKNIREALCQVDPQHRAYYQANSNRYLQDLKALHSRIQKRLTPYKNRLFLIYHPELGYFARTYNLKQVAVEVEGKTPAPQQLQALIKTVRNTPLSTMFVSIESGTSIPSAFSESMGCKMVIINPMAADYIQNLDRLSLQLVDSFKR